jgi:hypothetical protein
LERVGRIELPLQPWQGWALPLCNTRIAPPSGLEPETLELTALCSAD